MDDTIIRTSNVWFTYNGAPVLENVNLEVREGEFMAMIGPNGGGKTTLIKLLLGLLTPNQGHITVFGKAPSEAALDIGYVPQNNVLHADMPVSVSQVVMMGLLRGGGGWARFTGSDRASVKAAIDRVGMKNFSQKRMKELSGGQRQRVLVARALVSGAKLLILDEPFSNVDSAGQTEFYQLLKELNESVTIVMVSHDLLALSAYVKSVACVNRQVHFHNRPEITPAMLRMAYHCPVELIAHGLPHRVLDPHSED